MRRVVGMIAMASAAAATLSAQTPAPQQPPGQTPPISAALGVFAYPKAGQDGARQAVDQTECYQWAKQTTGLDPLAQASAASPGPQTAQKNPDGTVVKGAAAGAGVGALAGDAGDGAKVGVGVGLLKRRREARKEKEEAEQRLQAQQKGQAQAQQAKETFNKAYSACLEGRDYSVK